MIVKMVKSNISKMQHITANKMPWEIDIYVLNMWICQRGKLPGLCDFEAKLEPKTAKPKAAKARLSDQEVLCGRDLSWRSVQT